MTHRLTAALLAAGLGLAATPLAAKTYVVVADGNSFDNRLAAQIERSGGLISARLPQIGVAIVESDAPGFAAEAASIRGVRSVNPDISLQFDIPEAVELDSDAVEAALGNPPNSGSADFFFDLQWGHTAIGAVQAWDRGIRGAGVTVAVLDSGINCDHPDLVPNIDFSTAASFVPDEDVCLLPPGFSHGSHVAGTVAAAENDFGTIGVAPDATIMPVKVLSAFTGSGGFAGIIQGIMHATQNGAHVINMSLGVSGGLPHDLKDEDGNSLAAAVAELFVATGRATTFATQNGTLVVASAGNDARDLDKDASNKAFPAELPNVVAVSAMAPIGWALDPENADFFRLSSFSNFGKSGVDFAAPGGDFVLPGNDVCNGPVVVRPCWVLDMVFSTSGKNAGGANLWSWSAGTSMAAPHVSGTAALIQSAYGGTLTPAQVLRELRRGAFATSKSGKSSEAGHGHIDAAAVGAN